MLASELVAVLEQHMRITGEDPEVKVVVPGDSQAYELVETEHDQDGFYLLPEA